MDCFELLDKIHEEKPLVQHITNWVTIYDCANVTRAFGALPVMAHAKEEVEQMVGIASALVLNIGTLTPELIDSMITAGIAANQKGIPIVLDAVGVGATDLRTDSTRKILENVKIDVIKGNAGEIGVLAGVDAEVKGVESISVSGDPKVLAEKLAQQAGCTVIVTAKVDIVTDGVNTYLVGNGHELMGEIVGTGCMAASIIGSFCAVSKDYAKAGAYALALYGLAAERAAENAQGGGSFKVNLFDEIQSLPKKEKTGVKITD